MLKEKGFGVPAAIVTAGLIIALAIIFGGGMKKDVKTGSISADASTVEIAEELGVKEKALNKCVAKGDALAKVESDMEIISILGGSLGTPTSFVLDTKTGNTITIPGAQPVEVVRQLITQILADDPELAKLDVDVEIPAITEADHVNGSRDARIQIVEYSDFDCPFCGRFHETMNQIMTEYGEEGNVAWIYRHAPIEQLHPDAKNKAVISECIADLEGEEAFWEFTNVIFKN